MASELTGLFVGAVSLGVVHGVEPGHGWPVAAAYAMEKRRKWVHGALAGIVLGVGHLVSSLAMVVAFFAAKSYFDLGEASWLPTVAGVLLILLGLNELRGGGRGHDHEDSHGHVHGDASHDHSDGHTHDDHSDDHTHDDGLFTRLRAFLPSGGHGHDHSEPDDPSETTLASLASFAFVLGFAHEEEFEIILLCSGSNYCLELMTAYALTVVVGIVGLTLLLVAGYYRYEERVAAVAPYFPTISALVLIGMGLGFVFGVF
ncbi:hypothetical protein SAMN04488063_1356 [Halopelagius inordinatus]|uniref:ABC-type nickel/cobalt efflux system, permease component RcnA n=1 Tax=Halopelagius inordinatus TaxID=553467 RepID=A0A1I2NXW5_9EURY|nr:hypothetical protein [Halopelagius inordinatus]SFG07890.1 hypothetical protein SAMN04488063_1356 [Halopelagius inordinatus]